MPFLQNALCHNTFADYEPYIFIDLIRDVFLVSYFYICSWYSASSLSMGLKLCL